MPEIQRRLMPEAPPDPPKLLASMPRPVMVVFGVAALVALVAGVMLIVRPPRFAQVSLAETRPVPRAPYSHDPAGVVAAPTPAQEIPFDPPCGA